MEFNVQCPAALNLFSPAGGCSTSHNRGDRLQVDLTSHLRDLTLRAYYTLSRAIDPTNAGSGRGDLGNVSNPHLGWKYDEGPSEFDRTHNGAVNFIYDIPFLRNSSNRLLKATVGGWGVSRIVTLTSGLPKTRN